MKWIKEYRYLIALCFGLSFGITLLWTFLLAYVNNYQVTVFINLAHEANIELVLIPVCVLFIMVITIFEMIRLSKIKKESK